MSIEIVNMKTAGTRSCKRVDRATVLGNPFHMRDRSLAERNRVCDAFAAWFPEAWRKSPAMREYMASLAADYVVDRELTLGCWCAPDRCHAETIRDELLKFIDEHCPKEMLP